MIIRPAVIQDAHAIATVHVTSWHETYTGIIPASYLATLDIGAKERMWTSVLQRGLSVFVAEVDGQVVGFSYASKTKNKEPVYPGEIYTMYILQAFHKRGLGKLLFEQVKSYLVGQSMFPFVTFVLADNPALGFYQHMGAKIIGEHEEDFDGCKLNELQLLWE